MNNSTQFFGSGYGQCSICETPLDVHEQLQGFCGSPECLRQAALRADNEKRVRKRAQLLDTVEEMLTSLPDYDTETVISVVITPSNDRQLSRLPVERIDAFREHLLALFSGIVDSSDTDTDFKKALTQLTDSSSEASLNFAQACGHCRGQCCLQGNRANAFISESTIRRQLPQVDVQSARELLQKYIGLVPEYSFEYSCVYHGETGCALPQTMRSDVCNDFYCKHLSLVDEDEIKTAKKIFFVAEDNHQPIRSSLIVSDA